MKLYKLTANIEQTFASVAACIVCASDANDARLIHPLDNWYSSHWASGPADVTAEEIGEALPTIPRGVVLVDRNSE